MRNRALADVEAAYRAYETAREQVRAYEAGLLRQADESREIQLGAYQEGAAELITLIEAQKTELKSGPITIARSLTTTRASFNWNWQPGPTSNYEHTEGS